MHPNLYQIMHTLIFLIRMILIKAFFDKNRSILNHFFDFVERSQTQLAVGVSLHIKMCATSEGVKFFIYIF